MAALLCTHQHACTHLLGKDSNTSAACGLTMTYPCIPLLCCPGATTPMGQKSPSAQWPPASSPSSWHLSASQLPSTWTHPSLSQLSSLLCGGWGGQGYGSAGQLFCCPDGITGIAVTTSPVVPRTRGACLQMQPSHVQDAAQRVQCQARSMPARSSKISAARNTTYASLLVQADHHRILPFTPCAPHPNPVQVPPIPLAPLTGGPGLPPPHWLTGVSG
jgi:hypothetical protein